MQAIQKDATGQGVVWLMIISSVPGTRGHVSPGRADELTKTRHAGPTAVLLDSTGAVGKIRGDEHAARVRDRPRGHARLHGGDRRLADVAQERRPGLHGEVLLTTARARRDVA